jgi:phosphatidylglycerophosphate synthase
MDPNLIASQKQHDMLAAYWPRKVSPYLTSLLLPTRITPNQTTMLWGLISVLNSGFVYLALTGSYWAIPVIPLVYVFTFVLDCSDGEIARYRNIANPIGGKLLDGISHRATEYSLLSVFVLAAGVSNDVALVLPVAALLFSGDAMYSYCYERRLSTLRSAGFTGRVKRESGGVYERGTPWRGLSRSQQIGTIVGQLQYKSVYPIIVASYVSSGFLLGTLAALGAYKHWKWIRLMATTLTQVSTMAPAPEPERARDSVPAASAGVR